MTSNAICNYSGADWERNSQGHDACLMYAQLQGYCNANFVINNANAAGPPYQPQLNSCGCNIVAYNLMAGCGWCQNNIYSDWWLTLAEWQGNCTTAGVTYSANLPSNFSTAATTINLPAWATIQPDLATWDPAQAYDVAIAATPSLTLTDSVSSTPFPTATGQDSLSDILYSLTHSTSPFTYTGPFSGDDNTLASAHNAGKTAGIVVGVILGIDALLAIGVIVVYFIRQNQRRAWYGPMAQYYSSMKGGQPGLGQPLLYNNQTPYDPVKTPATTNSGGYSYQPPPPDTTAPYVQSYVQPSHTGYSANTNTTSVYGGVAPGQQPGYQAPPYSIPPTPANNTYVPPPPGPPPQNGPGGMGYRGHAEF